MSMCEAVWAGGRVPTLCRCGTCFLHWYQEGSPSQLQVISSEGEHTVAHFSKRNPFPHSNLDFQVNCLNFIYSSIVKRHFAVHSNYIGRADFTPKQPVCRLCRQHRGNTTSFGPVFTFCLLCELP